MFFVTFHITFSIKTTRQIYNKTQVVGFLSSVDSTMSKLSIFCRYQLYSSDMVRKMFVSQKRRLISSQSVMFLCAKTQHFPPNSKISLKTPTFLRKELPKHHFPMLKWYHVNYIICLASYILSCYIHKVTNTVSSAVDSHRSRINNERQLSLGPKQSLASQ